MLECCFRTFDGYWSANVSYEGQAYDMGFRDLEISDAWGRSIEYALASILMCVWVCSSGDEMWWHIHIYIKMYR